jgi:hypothetical protein
MATTCETTSDQGRSTRNCPKSRDSVMMPIEPTVPSQPIWPRLKPRTSARNLGAMTCPNSMPRKTRKAKAICHKKRPLDTRRRASPRPAIDEGDTG